MYLSILVDLNESDNLISLLEQLDHFVAAIIAQSESSMLMTTSKFVYVIFSILIPLSFHICLTNICLTNLANHI